MQFLDSLVRLFPLLLRIGRGLMGVLRCATDLIQLRRKFRSLDETSILLLLYIVQPLRKLIAAILRCAGLLRRSVPSVYGLVKTSLEFGHLCGGWLELVSQPLRSGQRVMQLVSRCRELGRCLVDSCSQITMLGLDPLEVFCLADKRGGVFLNVLLQLPGRGLRLLKLRFKCRKPGRQVLFQRRHSLPQLPKLITCCRRE